MVPTATKKGKYISDRKIDRYYFCRAGLALSQGSVGNNYHIVKLILDHPAESPQMAGI